MCLLYAFKVLQNCYYYYKENQMSQRLYVFSNTCKQYNHYLHNFFSHSPKKSSSCSSIVYTHKMAATVATSPSIISYLELYSTYISQHIFGMIHVVETSCSRTSPVLCNAEQQLNTCTVVTWPRGHMIQRSHDPCGERKHKKRLRETKNFVNESYFNQDYIFNMH